MANEFRPISGQLSFFSRMRILAGGQIWEDFDLNNRVYEMFNNFRTEGSRYNDYAEGFGHVWESGGVHDSRARAIVGNANNGNVVSYTYQGYLAHHSRPLYSSHWRESAININILHCVSCQSLSILSLVDDYLEHFVFNFEVYVVGAPANGFTHVKSSTWQIQNVQGQFDII